MSAEPRYRTGFEPMSTQRTMAPTPLVYSDHHRRHSSITEDMTTINEDLEEDFSDRRPFARAPIPERRAPISSKSSSILRHISTRLRAGGSQYRTRPGQRRDYANIQEPDGDLAGVDLSSLAGLGIELRERPTSTNPARIESEDDTAYKGANSSSHAPSFNDFRRRTLGSGMVIGATLQHDFSKLNASAEPGRSSSIEDKLHRIKTVRKVGRNLAEERGQIVAYKEEMVHESGFDQKEGAQETAEELNDLSLLEGSRIKHRQSTTFDQMNLNRASTTMPDTHSYFFPTDPDIPDWKPIFMRPPFLIMLSLIAFGLAGLQEGLCQMSLHKGRQDPATALLAFNNVNEVSVFIFFVWKYLPTGITIFYAVLFSLADFEIRRLEPYYQLSKPQGARASASINLDHLTMFQYFVPFNAARLGQWAVLASTIGNIIAATIAPALQNPAVDFGPNPNCVPQRGCPDDGSKMFWVSISPAWSRAVTTAYAVVGLTLLFLLWQLRRKSGLLSDPKGIAGIASMATKSHILQDFKDLDLATRGDIHKRLAHRTYVLYKSSIWQGEYTPQPDSKEFQESGRRLESPHPIMLRLTAGIPFILSMVFCLAAVPVISITKANIVPNKVPWLPILVATILKMIWSTFEADVRLMEPFYQLSKGNCVAKNSLTLDYQSTIYGWMPIKAAMNRHFLVAVVGLSSILLDILSVTIGSFSVDSGVFLRRKDRDPATGQRIADDDETYVSFWVSFGLSVCILIFVIAVATLVYVRRRHPFLPREPSTIAAVLSFIYSSKMLTDFIDTEKLDNKGMEARLMNLGKRYGLGWFRGRDGKVHCAIDEEPMVSRYVHGVPYSNAVSGPLQEHETFFYP